MTRPQRLPDATYVGAGAYSLTFCTRNRALFFTNAKVVEMVRAEFLHTADREGFQIFIYCFMPDHAHVLIVTQQEEADMTAFCKIAKQRAGYWYKQTYGASLWQDGYTDRILRSDESIVSVTRYIIENPVRAGLVKAVEDYPFWGSGKWTREELLRVLADVNTVRC